MSFPIKDYEEAKEMLNRLDVEAVLAALPTRYAVYCGMKNGGAFYHPFFYTEKEAFFVCETLWMMAREQIAEMKVYTVREACPGRDVLAELNARLHRL